MTMTTLPQNDGPAVGSSSAANPLNLATETIPSAPPDIEQTYGGYSRFEIELEFVQSLANPAYLNHLASQKFLQQPAFIAYLEYLQYWSRPPYLRYLTYPGPTLRNLELLQTERFRGDILGPGLVQTMIKEGMKAGVEWHKED